MKKLITIAIFLTSFIGVAQTYEIYETVNGIQSPVPKQVVEKTETEVRVYETTNGVKNVAPSQIIEKKEDKIEVYETTNGIKNVTPTQIIKKDATKKDE